jgi:hypothetical protein
MFEEAIRELDALGLTVSRPESFRQYCQRFNILRSTDCGGSWDEVYSFEPETEHVHGAQGLRVIVFGYTTPGGGHNDIGSRTGVRAHRAVAAVHSLAY